MGELLHFVYLWVKFSDFNAVLRVSRRRKHPKLSLRNLFLCVHDKFFIQVLLFQETYPAVENSCLRACDQL